MAWLKTEVGVQPVFATSELSSRLPSAAEYKDAASGLLCLSIPEPDPSYVVWFKPEVVQNRELERQPEQAREDDRRRREAKPPSFF